LVAEVDRVAVVSGSCSPETEASIRWALNHGYVGVRLDVRRIADGSIEEALKASLDAASQGRSFVLYTALGLHDEGYISTDAEFQARLGAQLGRLTRDALLQSGIGRAAICGGDTSSRVGRELGAFALTAIRPIAPGSPLCRLWSDGPIDGLEIVLKGGQRGGPQFFDEVRRGSTF
jgi:uncharacterized protein YgbK (DUF1537 family)